MSPGSDPTPAKPTRGVVSRGIGSPARIDRPRSQARTSCHAHGTGVYIREYILYKRAVGDMTSTIPAHANWRRPGVVAETKRLRLRHFVHQDADFIAHLLNTRGFLQNIGDRGVRTPDDALGYLENEPLSSYRVNGFGTYMVTTRLSDMPVGMAGLTRKAWLPYPDLACALLPEAEGRGYATEASLAVLAYAVETLKLERVLAVAVPANRNSIRVLEKLGFTAAGTIVDPRDGATLSAFEWVAPVVPSRPAELVIDIRPYTAADEASCRACIIERQDAERQIDPRLRAGEDMVDEYLRVMRERCRLYAGVILIAAVAGEVVGLAMVLARVPFEELDEPPGEHAIVAELVVRDAYRRRGIGAALLRAAERHAREAGACELRIGVLRENHAARRLYIREGFATYLETLSKPLTGTGKSFSSVTGN